MAKAALTSEEVDHAVVRYESGASTVEIARDDFADRVNSDTVVSWLRKRKVRIRSHRERLGFSIDQKFFSVIDSEIKAYWLGFLIADGCLAKANGQRSAVRFFLSSKDAEAVLQMKEDLRFHGKVYVVNRQPSKQVGIVFSRVNMGNDLIRLGFLDWKDGCPRLFDHLPNDMVRHFIRGFFDGDGCISGDSITFASHVDHLPCMQRVADVIAENAGVSIPKIAHRYHRGHYLAMAWCGRHNVQRIGHWMYRDATRYLSRKRERFSAYIDPVNFSFLDVTIRKVDKKSYMSFYKKYHYLGRHSANGYSVGAFLGEEMIAAATFGGISRREVASKQGLDPSKMRELRRFCIHPNYHKKNFATWFMAKAVKQFRASFPDVSMLVSFADPIEGHNGTIYKAANWSYDGSTNRSYHYEDEFGTRIHKKTVYDRAKRSGLTERQYMERKGLSRVSTPPKERFLLDLSSPARRKPPSA